MRAISGLALLMGAATALAACAERVDTVQSRRPYAEICTPFVDQATTPTDPSAVAGATVPGGPEAAAFDDCLHRWGYRLALSADPADLVAAATLAACAPVLSRWNQATLAQTQAGDDSAVSLVTGETTDTLTDRYQSAHSKALFYVIQGRAGGCDPPPRATAATQ